MIASAVFPEESQSASNTLLQVYAANANRPLQIVEIGFSLQAAATAAIKFELVIQTNAGTGGTAVTPVNDDQTDPEAIEATVLRKPTGSNWSAEPTTTDILKSWFVYDTFLWQPSAEDIVKISGGARIAVRLPDAPGTAVDITGYITWKE